jgi:putative photosynthetic complex assembly protein
MSQRVAAGSSDIPRVVLAGAGVLIGLTVLSAALAHRTGIGRTTLEQGTPVERLSLAFADQPDGAILVTASRDRVGSPDGGQDRPAPSRIELPAGGDAFLRATMRGLTRERLREGIGPAPAFLLTRWSDGTLTLDDPSTGRRISLDVFGPTNAAAFARLFSTGRDAQ